MSDPLFALHLLQHHHHNQHHYSNGYGGDSARINPPAKMLMSPYADQEQKAENNNKTDASKRASPASIEKHKVLEML